MFLSYAINETCKNAILGHKFSISFDYSMVWKQKSRKPNTGSRLL